MRQMSRIIQFFHPLGYITAMNNEYFWGFEGQRHSNLQSIIVEIMHKHPGHLFIYFLERERLYHLIIF